MKEQKDKDGNRKVSLVKVDNYDLNLDLINDRDRAIDFFTSILKGRKSGVTSPAEAMMVYGRCKELSLPFLSTIDHMAVIGGKVCADIHIKTALALRAGNSLWWEKTKDYEPQYKYTDSVSTWISPHKPIKFLEELIKEDPYAVKLRYAWDPTSWAAVIKEGFIPFGNGISHNTPCDYVTEYTMYRIRKLSDGTIKTLTTKGSFSSLEGHVAQLGYGTPGKDYEGRRDPNGNWGKYEKRMVDVRAFDNAIKVIGADLLMGMPEISEMAEVTGVEYSFDPDTGNASVSRDYREDPTDVEIIPDDEDTPNSSES